jgi:phosphatidylglycerophosphate synthase
MTDPEYVPERRPITSREHPLSIRIASRIAGLGVSPNAISVAGMIAGILAGLVFALTTLPGYGWILFIAAAALMQLRLLANMLDGMVAVQTGRASPLGELFNEVPDRVSDTAIFVGAGYAAGSLPELGFLSAITALLTAYIRAEGKVAGGHQEFCGPMAKPQRMAVMTFAALYAGLAPAGWQLRLESWPGGSTMAMALLLIMLGSAFTFLRRLLRIGRALRKDQT